MRFVGAAVAVLVIPGCAAPHPSPSSLITLPTQPPIDVPSGVLEGRRGGRSDAVLHRDAADSPFAWLVTHVGTRIDVMWPPGYQARFAPNLEVLDASGVVVPRGGAHITGGCVTPERDVLLLEPPFG